MNRIEIMALQTAGHCQEIWLLSLILKFPQPAFSAF
jgi:hypothetical protein